MDSSINRGRRRGKQGPRVVTGRHAAFATTVAISLAAMACADPVPYRMDRRFVATTNTVSTASVYSIVTAAGTNNLTGIIKSPSPITTNSATAREYEGVAWGFASSSQAWNDVFFDSYPSNITSYSEIFSDPGWVTGTRTAYGKEGAYMWILQNTLGFNVPGTTLYTNSARTYLLRRVLVGTLGNYAPGASYTNAFPTIDDPDGTNWPGCTFLTSDMPTNSQTVKYNFDMTSYYPLETVEIIPKGQATESNSSANVKFELVEGSLTAVVWTITPELTNGARFADGSTGCGTNLYAIGETAWITPGARVTNYIISATHAEGCCTGLADLVVHREINWTPAGNEVFVWEPVKDGQFETNFIASLVASNHYQGWTVNTGGVNVTWFSDPCTNDDDCGTCTLANLKAMTNAGIAVVLAHGTPSNVEIARFATSNAAAAWIGNEVGIVAVDYTNYVSAVAHGSWFKNNWQLHLNRRRSLVFLQVCSSDDGATSLASSVGGETVIGLTGQQNGVLVDSYYGNIVEFMNGTRVGVGTTPMHRAARHAVTKTKIDAGGSADYLHVRGSGRTTLCPCSQTALPGSVSLLRWGCIVFDTYMGDSFDANQAVTCWGNQVDGRCWRGDTNGSFYVDFGFVSGFCVDVSMEAVADKCLSRPSYGTASGHKLDGDAEAPNGDSHFWDNGYEY